MSRPRWVELLVASGIKATVVGREDEPGFQEQAPVYAAMVQWAMDRKGDASGDIGATVPTSARPWFGGLSSRRQGALRR